MSKVLATQNRKIKPNGKKGVEIRLASGRKDINEMINLGRLAHEESLYADLPYDENKLILLGAQAQERPDNHGLIMAELQGELIGFLVCIADEHFFPKHKRRPAWWFSSNRNIEDHRLRSSFCTPLESGLLRGKSNDCMCM